MEIETVLYRDSANGRKDNDALSGPEITQNIAKLCEIFPPAFLRQYSKIKYIRHDSVLTYLCECFSRARRRLVRNFRVHIRAELANSMRDNEGESKSRISLCLFPLKRRFYVVLFRDSWQVFGCGRLISSLRGIDIFFRSSIFRGTKTEWFQFVSAGAISIRGVAFFLHVVAEKYFIFGKLSSGSSTLEIWTERRLISQ